LLNTRKRLIRVDVISQGTLDTILVHPREVFRAAIVANAAGIVLVHNHPSGDPTPSEADIKVTRDLIRAGQLLKIEVVDHIIIGHATAERTKDIRHCGNWDIFTLNLRSPCRLIRLRPIMQPSFAKDLAPSPPIHC